MHQKSLRVNSRNCLIWLCFSMIILALLLLLLKSGEVQAQGNTTLTNGSVVTGTINDQTHIVLYNFSGKAGDLITAQVIGTTPGMNPTLSLLAPGQQHLADNNSDPYSPASLTDARISYLLTSDGTYSILVGGTNGEYVLRFAARQSSPATTLGLNVPAVTTIATGNVPQLYTVSAIPGTGISLTFSTNSAGFSYGVQIFDSTGQLIAMLGGPTVQAQSLTLCANTSMYELLVSAGDSPVQGTVTILATTDRSGVCSGTQNANVVPPGSTAQPPTSLCSATSIEDFDVNLRGGPSAFFGIVGQLPAHGSVTINGRNAENNWYAATVNGRNVWVAASLVALSGPCGSLPVLQSAPPPFTFTPPPSATPIVVVITATREKRRTATPAFVTITPIIITQTPVIITATPVTPSPTP